MASARRVSIEMSSTDSPGSRGSEENERAPRDPAEDGCSGQGHRRRPAPVRSTWLAPVSRWPERRRVGDGVGVGMGRRFLASSGSGKLHSKGAAARGPRRARSRGLDLYCASPRRLDASPYPALRQLSRLRSFPAVPDPRRTPRTGRAPGASRASSPTRPASPSRAPRSRRTAPSGAAARRSNPTRRAAGCSAGSSAATGPSTSRQRGTRRCRSRSACPASRRGSRP